MFKRLLCVFLAFSTVSAYSEEKAFPQIIDFSKIKLSEIPGYDSFDKTAMEKFAPFNGAVEFCPYFAYLKNTFNIHTGIETGTWMGNTTAFLAFLFDHVFTMEINLDVFNQARANLHPYQNIRLSYGDSPDILQQILPSLRGQRILFYLDAHWLADWPLLSELDVISKTHRDNCIIVIDDFKVPDRNDIPYDSYGGHECSYEYVQQQLNKIYSDYSFHYLIPRNVASRAKFVAIPKKWASQA